MAKKAKPLTPDIGKIEVSQSETLQPKLQPTFIKALEVDEFAHIDLLPGDVLVLALSDTGEPIKGNHFTVAESQWNKTFEKAKHKNESPKFQLKKKAQ